MRPVVDPEAWDDLVLALPSPHLLQSRPWGDFKGRWGWSVARFVWGGAGRESRATEEIEAAGGIEAAAQVLTRRVGRLPLRVGYLPKGPLLRRPGDPALWDRVLGDLEAWARQRGLVQLKMDADMPAAVPVGLPAGAAVDVPAGEPGGAGAIPVAAPAVTEVWRRRGWRPSAEQIQFPNTMLSDLTTGEAGLRAAMKAKTRYNLGLAARRGVTVRHGGREDLGAFYALYAATGARAGFGVRARAYYLDAWSTFLDLGRATVILAEKEGRPLAGVIPVAFADTVWYLYGASSDEGRDDMPAYLAQWESLRWAIARGAARYDWWGGPGRLDARDPLWGVYRFKAGFGAVLAAQQGAWDFPAGGWRYGLYHWADRLRRGWIGRR